MTIDYKGSKRIVLDTGVTFEDDDFAGWTLGTGQSLTAGVLYSPKDSSNVHDVHGFKSYAIGEPDDMVLNWDWKYVGAVFKLPFIMLASDASAGARSSSNAGGYGDPLEGHKRIILLNNNATFQAKYVYHVSGGSLVEENQASNSATPVADTMYYYQFIKDGNDISVKRYGSIADRTAQTNAQQTITDTWADDAGYTGTADLAYIVIGSYGNYADDAGKNYMYDFKLYSGVTTPPSKPTNVQDNSILIEKDTAKRYWRTPDQATVSDDLTTNKGWTATGTGNGYNASDYVDFKIVAPDSSAKAGGQVLIDLQDSDYLNGSNLSDTAWVIRTKINFSALDQATANENIVYFGFFSTDAWGGTAQDAFVLRVKLDYGQSSKLMWVKAYNNSTFEGSSNHTVFTAVPATSTDYYIEFTRDGNDFTIRVTTNSDYTGGETQSQTLADVTSLRYFGWKGRGDTQNNGGNVQGTIKPIIRIYNAVTTATPATWTMEPTFEDDFSTYADTTAGDAVWTTNDTARMRVNPSTDVFDFTTTRNGTASTSYKTLTSVSDTAWLLRFRFNMTSSTSDARLFVGLSSTTGNYGSTEDWLGIIIPNRQHTTWSIRGYDGAAVTIGTYDSFSLTPSLATDYFVELIRVSATSFKLNLYSDSGYSTLINSVTHTIPSTLVGLSYLKIMNMNNDSAGYTMTGIIDDVSFYNGVSSL